MHPTKYEDRLRVYENTEGKYEVWLVTYKGKIKTLIGVYDDMFVAHNLAHQHNLMRR
jgi:hypothetical protein